MRGTGYFRCEIFFFCPTFFFYCERVWKKWRVERSLKGGKGVRENLGKGNLKERERGGDAF